MSHSCRQSTPALPVEIRRTVRLFRKAVNPDKRTTRTGNYPFRPILHHTRARAGLVHLTTWALSSTIHHCTNRSSAEATRSSSCLLTPAPRPAHQPAARGTDRLRTPFQAALASWVENSLTLPAPISTQGGARKKIEKRTRITYNVPPPESRWDWKNKKCAQKKKKER